MMNTSAVSGRRLAAMLLSAAAVWLATIAGAAWADPPAQAGRLAFAQGPVSYAPGGDDAWIEAQINRPLTVGDRLWAGDNGRAEIELPGATVRMSELTSVSLLNLDDRIVQLQVAQGRVNVRVRTLPQGETFEIDTPNAAFVIERVGDYRIDVDAQAGATTIALRDGTGSVYGDGAAFALRRGDTVRVYGTDLAQREFYALAPADGFDRWARERDRRFESSTRRATYRRRSSATPISTHMARGGPPRALATCGSRAMCRRAGRRTVTDTGRGSIRGAGPGSTTHHGALRRSTMAAGRMSAGRGAGCRGRCACVRSTRPRWSHSSAAPISRSRSAAAQRRRNRLVPARAWRSVSAGVCRKPRLRAQRQRQQHDHQHDGDQQHLPEQRDAGELSQRASGERRDGGAADGVCASATGAAQRGHRFSRRRDARTDHADRGGRADSRGYYRCCRHNEQPTGARSAAAIGRRAIGAARAGRSGRAARGNAAA